MDQYIGGIEHAILHLLYARFWTKVMRDLGLVKVDEPFSKLLTQGMVLNHIFYKRNEKGGKDYFPPTRSTTVLDAQGRISRRHAQADGTTVEYGGVGKMGKSERQRRRPAGPDREVRRRHRAPVHHVHRAARGHARVERRGRRGQRTASCAGSGTSAWRSRRERRRRLAVGRPGLSGKDAKALRREVHTVLRADRLRLPAHAIQHRGLGRDEAAQRAGRLQARRQRGRPRPRCARASASCCACLYPATPHIAQQLWNELGYDEELRRPARRALARGRRRPRWCRTRSS